MNTCDPSVCLRVPACVVPAWLHPGMKLQQNEGGAIRVGLGGGADNLVKEVHLR
jgi:hypothetical protein